MRNFRSLAVASLALCAAFLASCDEHPTSPATIAGRYQYTAYNAADSVVVAGLITLANPDSTRLTGSWVLAAVNGAVNIGPQTGAGTLAGSTASGVSIDLNPGWADNNVILFGTHSGREIAGTWQWVTLTGVTADGRFVMKKR
jgi:hypothetical protein